MFTLLSRLFIKNYDQPERPEVHRAYGTLCTMLIIALNMVLVVAKLLTAKLASSYSIRADAINNLTDVGSSLLLLLAFHFAGMKPQPNRPFGHGRIEYIAGIIIAGIIIYCGIETAKNAIQHILHPADLAFSWLAAGVLIGSIAMKFYMSYFSMSVSRKIHSEALHATGLDCMSDTITTGAALAGLLLHHFLPHHLNLDGWLALFVSVIIIKAGVDSAKGTLLQLLGTKPSPELVGHIEQICRNHPEVIGVHDLVVHDYGPGRMHVSVHCEVPGNGDIYVLHDAMDCIMKELDHTIGCTSVIHMDPVCTDDEHINEMCHQLADALKTLGEGVKIHDFRLVEGPSHTNVLFDCVVPFDVQPDEAKAEEQVREIVHALWKNAFPIVKIDRPYV